MKEPKVAIYIRLSMADEDTRRSKEESDSVQHQRLLIHEFLNRHLELKDGSTSNADWWIRDFYDTAGGRQRDRASGTGGSNASAGMVHIK